jgi:hypothetical protein
MITLKMQGGLGIRLFQYCSARILAENSDLRLYSPRIDESSKLNEFILANLSHVDFRKSADTHFRSM